MIEKTASGKKWREVILQALPENLRAILAALPEYIAYGLEEIRIRECRPLMVYSRGRDYFISERGEITFNPCEAYYVTHKDVQRTLQLISEYSIYAVEEELKNGYLTLKGGYRVGVAGKAVVENGEVKTLKYISSFNIRISREIPGAADKVIPFIIDGNSVHHTLILSPPKMGKTTLLRDLARQLSDGFPGFRGVKVGVVDERSEIAGCFQGIPQNSVGVRTDVLDACPKVAGIMMFIRSMSPDVIVTDEIGRPEDVDALEDALNAGIKVIATAHGRDLIDVLRRPVLARLINKRIFERIVVLGNSLGTGTLEKVYDGQTLEKLLDKPVR